MKTGSFILTVLSLIFLTSLSSCYFSMRNLGPTVEEEINIGSFEGLKVSSGVDIKLIQSDEHRVVIKANEDLLDDVEVEVVNGTLKISVDRRWFRVGGNVEAEVTFVDLNSIDVSAGSDVESTGTLEFRDIEIEASSGSDLKLSLEASSVNLRTSSGSDAKLKGRAREFKAKASSGSDIDAYDFEVEDAILECSSGSDVKAWITETLSVKASSGSDIYYRGDPVLEDVSTSGGSDLHKR